MKCAPIHTPLVQNPAIEPIGNQNMQLIVENAVKDKRLKKNHIIILVWLNGRISSSRVDYVDTTCRGLGNVCGMTPSSAWHYVDRLEKLKYITKEVINGVSCGSILRLRFSNPFDLDKEFFRNKTQWKNFWKSLWKASDSSPVFLGDALKKLINPTAALKKTIYALQKPRCKNQHTIYSKINKSSKSSKSIQSSGVERRQMPKDEIVKKNTIVQDMIAALNKVTGWHVTVNPIMASWMKKAFDQKFKTVENWVKYLKYQIFDPSKIHQREKFIMNKLLKFAVINAALAMFSGESAAEINPVRSWGEQVSKVLSSREQTRQQERAEEEARRAQLLKIKAMIDKYGADSVEVKNEFAKRRVKASFRSKYGDATYRAWVRDLEIEMTQNGALVCTFPTKKHKDAVLKQYGEWVEKLEDEYGMVIWKVKGD